MKELFSSAISVFTSLALISSSAISYASAAGSVPVDSDLSRETLYLDEADNLTFRYRSQRCPHRKISAVTIRRLMNPQYSVAASPELTR